MPLDVLPHVREAFVEVAAAERLEAAMDQRGMFLSIVVAEG